jgi:hypothetical protein
MAGVASSVNLEAMRTFATDRGVDILPGARDV